MLLRAVLAVSVMQIALGCTSSPAPEVLVFPKEGPIVVSRPPSDVPEYIVDVKPEFDHVKYAPIIAGRVHGKLGYVYRYSDSFTIYGISDDDVEKIRRMPEVLKISKSTTGKLAADTAAAAHSKA